MPRRPKSDRRARALQLATILEAIESGLLSRQEAEQLLGFLQLAESGGPLPSRATWWRRAKQLRALGLLPPPTPPTLRFASAP